ncbi:MAG: PilW family protein [Planctomycetota bacterium]|jgi:prepilin-type N-terminal cleavage/methylation domain-containing protein
MRFAKDKLAGGGGKGFTLVELLVALAVTGIVLGAVAGLAYAMSTANDSADDTSEKQSQVRYATLRITELIRHCKLVCGAAGDDLVLWRADDNDDSRININELVYIRRGPGRDLLRLGEFSSSETQVVNLSDIETLVPEDYDFSFVRLIGQCSGVEFLLDTGPSQTKLVGILFELVESNAVRHYEISAGVRGWAGYLLGADGEIVDGDDD